MRIAIVTQEDAFAIPKNIERIIDEPGLDVCFVATVDIKGALVNRKSKFVAGFGLYQAVRMGVALKTFQVLDVLDRVAGCRLFQQKRSVESVARGHGIDFENVQNVNGNRFIQELKKRNIELVVSFSAPCVFKESLLNAAPLGCINLHCSPLPRYAGLLPSFWVLYHQEQTTGATVHYMDTDIDNGAILGQVQVPISEGMTMFQLIQKTKDAGGLLMVDVIKELQKERAEQKSQSWQDAAERSYFTWPTVAEMKEFRMRGGRFI